MSLRTQIYCFVLCHPTQPPPLLHHTSSFINYHLFILWLVVHISLIGYLASTFEISATDFGCYAFWFTALIIYKFNIVQLQFIRLNQLLIMLFLKIINLAKTCIGYPLVMDLEFPFRETTYCREKTKAYIHITNLSPFFPTIIMTPIRINRRNCSKHRFARLNMRF